MTTEFISKNSLSCSCSSPISQSGGQVLIALQFPVKQPLPGLLLPGSVLWWRDTVFPSPGYVGKCMDKAGVLSEVILGYF